MSAVSLVSPEPPVVTFSSRKPRLEALSGRPFRKTESDPAGDAELMRRSLSKISPMHSVEGYASTLFVASVAGAWIAVASTVTLPLLAAAEMMSRASRAIGKA
jgi:hypothetical protein